jgi:hypothetical protein
MKIAIYHKSVPNNNKNLEKPAILSNFSQGAKACGDEVIDVDSYDFVPSDVGIIQGWIHNDTDRSHLKLRQQVIQNTKYTLAVDSNLFLYKNKQNPGNYLRYSFNGVFPNTGIYCDNQIDPTRWNQIRQDLNLSLKDYRKNGNHILLCLQRNGGWSMGASDVVSWAKQTIAELRKHTDRPIMVRPHPGDKSSTKYLAGLRWNVSNSVARSLEQDLKNCWAVVNYNSSPTVGSAIEGFPIFVTDPDRSQCREIANMDLSRIETPDMPDRLPWVQRISMFHWNFEDLRTGRCWNHMRQYVSLR